MVARRPLLLFLIAAALASPAAAEPTPDALRKDVPGLIEQLGSEKYVERRSAQKKLSAIGLAAFDALYAAREHDDPEVATTAERLLSEMTVRWTQAGDPPAVREIIESYGRQDDDQRMNSVMELASLGDYQGLSALCRIAWYDLEQPVASRAALSAMLVVNRGAEDNFRRERPFALPKDGARALRLAIEEQEQLYGPSDRATARWLQGFTNQDVAADQAADFWGNELRRLRELNQRNGATIDAFVLNNIAWNLLREQLRAGQAEAAAKTIRDTIAEAPDNTASAFVRQAVRWILESKTDKSLDILVGLEPGVAYLKTKQGLYLIAEARLKQGKPELAEKLAKQAFDTELGPTDRLNPGTEFALEGRIVAAVRLLEEAHPEWARKELRTQILDAGYLSVEGAWAAWLLSDSLQDSAEYEAAAEALRLCLEEIEATPASERRYRQLIEQRDRFLQPVSMLKAHRDFFLALAARDRGDDDTQRAKLLAAIKLNDDNADILIAMYHASEPGDPYRRDAMKRIERLADTFEKKIDEEPEIAKNYNQWAWLVSNTEGDFDKAVRYSKRSLRLSPGSPGYLDTLGRCHYAAGDLESAIEVQRRAVEGQPQYQVMQRQLKLFENELAKKSEANADSN